MGLPVLKQKSVVMAAVKKTIKSGMISRNRSKTSGTIFESTLKEKIIKAKISVSVHILKNKLVN